MWISRALMVLVALCVAATGCAAASSGSVVQESADGRFEQVAVDDVEIWRSARGSSSGDDALVTGTVGYDEVCGVLLYSEEFDLRYPVVWPAGTEIERADPMTIGLPGGGTVEVGDTVAGGGGYHAELAMFDGCATSGETAIFNASGDVEVQASGGASAGASEATTETRTPVPALPLPDAARQLAGEVGVDLATAVHDYGRCRGEEVPPGERLATTLRVGEWTRRSGADASGWVGVAVAYPLPDTGELTYVLAFDDPDRPDLLVSAATYDWLRRGIDAGAAVNVGRVSGDVSPTAAALVLAFDDGLIASIASCGFSDDVGPIYDLLAADGRPATDAAALLEALIAQPDDELLDRLDPPAGSQPQPAATPRNPDGGVDLDIHPGGQDLAVGTIEVVLPLAWQELGGTICAAVSQGVSGCRAVRDLAREEPVEVSVRIDPAADLSLVWSMQPVGPAFVPVILGTTAPRCDVVLRATIEEPITDEATFRAIAETRALVVWAPQPPRESTPTDPTTSSPSTPAPPSTC